MSSEQPYILAIFLMPLIGGLLSYFTKKTIIFVAVLVSFSLSLLFWTKDSPTYLVLEWVPNYPFSFFIDSISTVLISLVTFISLWVIIFSEWYIQEDKPTYYLKLGLFVSSMLGVFLADHLILFFIFWELVGVFSYLLIIHQWKKKEVVSSGSTVFLTNRIADFFLLSGILLLVSEGGELLFSHWERPLTWGASVLIVIGAFGKSVQLPFSGWLEKAMVGPASVSALIHAATMVTAGVYLLVRLSDFISESIHLLIILVGVVTAIYAALVALNQFDLKKILAYSTISQIAYMMVAVGVYSSGAAVFHLWTHAFFKAGLFLAAAVIIAYVEDHFKKNKIVENSKDIRNMGGMKNIFPKTYWIMMLFGFSLMGMPLFSGFISKENIILSSLIWAQDQENFMFYIIPISLLAIAYITALYVFKIIFLVFFGKNTFQKTKSNESYLFVIPLIVLSVGCLGFLYNFNPFSHQNYLEPWIGESIKHGDSNLSLVQVSLASVLLIVPAFWFSKKKYKDGRDRSILLEKENLLSRGFYLQNTYTFIGDFYLVVAKKIGRIDKMIDKMIDTTGVGVVVFSKLISIFDRLIVDGMVHFISGLTGFIGDAVAELHYRQIQRQLVMILLLVSVIIAFNFFS